MGLGYFAKSNLIPMGDMRAFRFQTARVVLPLEARGGGEKGHGGSHGAPAEGEP